jgi:hypothetical protein
VEPGYDDPDGVSIVDPEGKAPAIGWMRVPEGRAVKNRIHIDIRVAGEGPKDMAVRERLIRPICLRSLRSVPPSSGRNITTTHWDTS